MSARSASARWWTWLPGLGLGLLLVVVVTLSLRWWFRTHERIEDTVTLPPQGEAAYNPLYLLRQTLRADGIDARSRQYLQLDAHPLGPDDTVLLYGDPRLLDEQDVAQLLNWVGRGGHLVLRLPVAYNVSRQQAPTRPGLLLDSLGVRLMPGRFCHDLQMPGDLRTLTFCGDQRFALDHDPPDVAWGDPDNGYVLARRPWRRGSVDVLAQLTILENRHLANPQYAALARLLLAPNYGHGAVHLVYGAQMPSLWRLLLEHGTMAWVPLLLALGAWLWLRMPRFGPLHPSPVPARRALLEHVQASGEHLYRHHCAAILHAALRDVVLDRLRRRDPLAASLESDARHAAIAAHTGIDAADVADALDADSNNARMFQQRMARLIELMRRL